MARADVAVEVQIRSPHDGGLQRAVLRLPRRTARGRLPIIFAPHPFSWSVDDDYYGGCSGLKAARHSGWRGVPSELGVAVLQPFGHHRAVEWCSMGYAGVIRDVPAWIDVVDDAVGIDRDRVYGCGLSMGGLESLLAAAHHPRLFAAVFAFNPVVDARAWYEDLARTESAELRAEGSDTLIAREVGGLPNEIPGAWAERSVFGAIDGLRTMPTTIWWSRVDLVVPRQAERHGKHLYDELKRRDPAAPVSEYDHTNRCGFAEPLTDDERWAIHESSEYAFAARWLLLHRRWRAPSRGDGASREGMGETDATYGDRAAARTFDGGSAWH